MKWVEGAGNFPARSTNGLYEIRRMASPESTFLAFYRGEGLFRTTSVGEPRKTVDEAKADAEAAFAKLEEASNA